MKSNKFRSPAFIKIKYCIVKCNTLRQLESALTMIANHPDIKESDRLLELYNEKNKQLHPDYHEEEIETILHRNLSTQ